eukprot:TRINITY_DN1148_c0_g1_i1.p1 TRINITY_DN1148_c0_g1~~TRINITY_DN1148_c0_g1_i1.p1  ORF type:complete len:783 (+),score=226.50 TRINITY_DN1148_c0_g1_i1:52-2349(+)
MPPKRSQADEDRILRLAIVNPDRCRPAKCQLDCKAACPVVRSGGLCIEVKHSDKVAVISEDLCIGCGACVKRCPYSAIQIIRLPSADLLSATTHRYGQNGFKLHRLPHPRPGQVLGLVGTNGIGKTTALQILSGKMRPNLGSYNNPPDMPDIIKYFRGSDLQGFFQKQKDGQLTTVLKPQYVDMISDAFKGKSTTVEELVTRRNVRDKDDLAAYCELLDMKEIWRRPVAMCSGGELQRVAICCAVVSTGQVFMFDEPSSYLDIKQRLKASRAIRSLCGEDQYVIVVEHDLAVLDYLSDFVCCLYGKAGAYGVVTHPYGVREGINVFLDGFIPSENMRFREPIHFRLAEADDGDASARGTTFKYPTMTKKMISPAEDGKPASQFTLHVEGGSYGGSDIVVLLGQNGMGKTTLIRMLAGQLQPDGGIKLPEMAISYKPQTISPKFSGTVRDLLDMKLQSAYHHPQFQTDVFKPLAMTDLLDRNVQELSGGERQRVAIVLCLGKPADLYLLDEPSAFLDSEQRLMVSKVIKRFILHSKRTAFVVEHDIIMASYLASKVIVYTGVPAVEATASVPKVAAEGLNDFLRNIDVTLRRDPENLRPRVNKHGSQKDREQKAMGNFFVSEAAADEAGRKKAEAAAKRAAKKKGEEDDAGTTSLKAMLTTGVGATIAAIADENEDEEDGEGSDAEAEEAADPAAPPKTDKHSLAKAKSKAKGKPAPKAAAAAADDDDSDSGAPKGKGKKKKGVIGGGEDFLAELQQGADENAAEE